MRGHLDDRQVFAVRDLQARADVQVKAGIDPARDDPAHGGVAVDLVKVLLRYVRRRGLIDLGLVGFFNKPLDLDLDFRHVNIRQLDPLRLIEALVGEFDQAHHETQ